MAARIANASLAGQAAYAVAKGTGPVTQVHQTINTPSAPTAPEFGLNNWMEESDTGVEKCKHGVLTERTGVSARGPWTGLFCPLPKGTADQCKPRFL